MKAKKQKLKVLGGMTLRSLDCDVNDIYNFAQKNPFDEGVLHLEHRRATGSKWTFSQYGAENSIKNILDGNAMDFTPPPLSEMNRRFQSNSVKRRKTYDEMDGELSVDMVLNGSMKPYRRKKKVNSRQRNLKIYISLTSAIGDNGDVLAYFARQATNKIYQHVSSGAMVTVYYVFCGLRTHKDGSSTMLRTLIKEGSKPIDFRRMACLSYPAYMRYFSIMSIPMANRSSDIARNFGHPVGGSMLKEVIQENYKEDNFILYDFMDWNENERQLNPVKDEP